MPKSDRPSNENLRAIYDKRAQEYIYRGADGFPARKHRGILEHLQNLAKLRLLEVGCGNGPYLAWLSKRDLTSIVGIDLSPRILIEARKRVQHEGQISIVRLVAADAVTLPFVDASFDLLLASQVIEHIPAARSALREMWRVMRPGGVLIISTDNRDNRVTQALSWPLRFMRRLLGFPEWHPPFPHRSYAQAEFIAMIRQAGFDVLEASTYRFSWPSRLVKMRFLVRFLDSIEERLIRYAPFDRWGDILLLVASRVGAPALVQSDQVNRSEQ